MKVILNWKISYELGETCYFRLFRTRADAGL